MPMALDLPQHNYVLWQIHMANFETRGGIHDSLMFAWGNKSEKYYPISLFLNVQCVCTCAHVCHQIIFDLWWLYRLMTSKCHIVDNLVSSYRMKAMASFVESIHFKISVHSVQEREALLATSFNEHKCVFGTHCGVKAAWWGQFWVGQQERAENLFPTLFCSKSFPFQSCFSLQKGAFRAFQCMLCINGNLAAKSEHIYFTLVLNFYSFSSLLIQALKIRPLLLVFLMDPWQMIKICYDKVYNSHLSHQ